MDWSFQFEQWQQALAQRDFAKVEQILVESGRLLCQTTRANRWDWFIEALERQDTCGFVASVFRRHPVPKTLMEPLLRAAVQFGDASSIKYFVLPCVESFGIDTVNEWFSARTANAPCVKDKAEMAEYWYRASRKARR